MDEHRFDGMTRAFAASVSRRATIAAAVAMLGFGASREVTAARGIRCRTGNQACTSRIPCCVGTCPTDPALPLRERFRCPCGEGEHVCSNKCVDMNTDERHCGACLHRCRHDEICVSGVCVHDLPPV